MNALQSVTRPAVRTPKKSIQAETPETELAKFRLIGDPTRMAILEELRNGECCVCDLAEVLGITQPLLSHHLRQLKDAGLIKDRKSGRWTYYVLVPSALDELVATLGKLRVPQPTHRQRCD